MGAFVTGGGYEDGNPTFCERQADTEKTGRTFFIIFGSVIALASGCAALNLHMTLEARGVVSLISLGSGAMAAKGTGII